MTIKRDKLGRFVKSYAPWNKGIPCREETKKKLSKIQKARKISGVLNPFYGKKHSEKVRKKISQRTRESMQNQEIREKISLAHKGKHYSLRTEFKKGFKQPKEWLEKRSTSFKGKGNPFYGKKHSERVKKNLSKRFCGEGSHFWKGGVSPQNKKLRRSLKFRRWRELVFKRDNYTCQVCRAVSGEGKHMNLHPHHIKPFSDFLDLRFELDNGITLCKECHLKLHANKLNLPKGGRIK